MKNKQIMRIKTTPMILRKKMKVLIKIIKQIMLKIQLIQLMKMINILKNLMMMKKNNNKITIIA